jgi:hypothetical protein
MLDLKALAAGRYKLGLDEAAKLPASTREDRAWGTIIKCKFGHIYPFSATELAATTDRPNVGAALRRLPFARSHQRGDRESTVVFPAEHLEKVAQLMRARKRSQPNLSPEQRDAARKRLADLAAAKARRTTADRGAPSPGPAPPPG